MTKIIIDCDPGVDDAIAILLALASPEIKVLGITTVAGNVELDKVHENARNILSFVSRPDIPLARGCERPLIARRGSKTQVHGNNGLAGVMLPKSNYTYPDIHAVDFIIDTVMSNPKEVTLCPTAPLTNIAMAMLKEPRLKDNVKDIVLMGGAAFCNGNITPAAEFNFYVDPHAAHIVFDTAEHITMLGLDVTHKADIRAGLCQSLEQGNVIARTAAKMSRGYAAFDPFLHDPCVIGYLIRPDIFTGINGHIDIEYESRKLFGLSFATVHDDLRPPKNNSNLNECRMNTMIITDVQSEKLMSLISERILSL
ncbi:nucleoside hydrolase [Proteus cibarius]|uniref:Nucleoside hydrolase n=1 Tax=Proteus terrae subsp. cibarius TaxID=626774 RepID=A0A6G6S703_9GAMM|nr:nucleoside hydrolase [Proteus terrae]ATN01077.1 nucleoside hydrolase [Proteus vulgaris]MBG2914829.1 nucleoside hydrolase [Proteus terrae subsp. cibarius]MBG3089450.1 nucleoside hydrolase [Proteus terrae subsp. cibarius]MBG6039282.1 nucleoside hydrolase [Proteus terrae subsp. cibarius]MCS6715924.1 nucleoside hydrolase [Proteus terrae]